MINLKTSKQISRKKLFSSLRENTIPGMRFYIHKISKSTLIPKISRFINNYLYHFGIGSSVNRYDNSFTIYSAFADKKLYSGYNKNDKFINFGSGAFYHKRWKNYDYPAQSLHYKNFQGNDGKDFFSIDLNKHNLKIFESEDSTALIYCSHTLEHLDSKSSEKFLSECFRILKGGGVLRLALPNIKNDFYLTKCLISQNIENEDIKKNYLNDAASHILTDARNINSNELKKLIEKSQFKSHLFYKNLKQKYPKFLIFNKQKPERHINCIDFYNLIKLSKKIGFSCVIPTYQGSSVALPFSNLHVFDNTEPHISFYADIIK